MRYLGGKARTAKHIAPILMKLRNPAQIYFEPFCGGCWVTAEMGFGVASDVCEPLISLYSALQKGWVPPSHVSEDEYQSAKLLPDSSPLKGFIMFGCSFGGKYGAGYARSGERNYAQNAKNSLLKKMQSMQRVTFLNKDYREYAPKGCLIYCDPPYKATTGYTKAGNFDSEEFWGIMRQWSAHNTVIISEYSAPQDFLCVAAFPTKTDMHTTSGKEPRIERLFKWDSLCN